MTLYTRKLAVLILMKCEREKVTKIFESIGINARFHTGELPSTFATFPLEIFPIPAVDEYFDPLDYEDYSDFSCTKYCRKRDMKILFEHPYSLAACYATIEQIERLSGRFQAEDLVQPRVWYWNQWLDANDVRNFKIHPSMM